MAATSRFALGIHLLTYLAHQRPGLVKSDELAETVCTNPVVVRRTLADLIAAGIVESEAGPCGGYRLALTPREIKLLDVHIALDGGSSFVVHRIDPKSPCPIARHIDETLTGVFDQVDAAIERELGKISLERILNRVLERA